jgi:prevent-host-death family protein
MFDLANDLVHDGPVKEVSVHEAKTHLSRLLRQVESGEEIVIARGGKPVARLVPATPARRREMGFDRSLVVPDDFDEPLDEETLRLFES